MPTLTDSDRYAIAARIRELRQTGNPMEATTLDACLAEDRHPPTNLMGKTGFNPEKDIAVPLQDLEVPPRAGRGASKTKWGEFALTVADIEPKIIDALERDEIIELLVSRGIIDAEGEVVPEVEVEVGDSDPEVEVEVDNDGPLATA